MEKNSSGLCFYISEDKTHKKNWTKANEQLHDFQNAGGRAIFLDKNSRIKFYALTALINRIDNGDVNLSDGKQVTRDDAKNFIKAIPLLDFPFTKRHNAENSAPAPHQGQHTTNAPEISASVSPLARNAEKLPVPSEEELKRQLLDIVNNSPMNIISIVKAIELLAQKKIIIDREKLSAFLKNNSKIFKTFPTKDDLLISSNKRNA